MIIPSGENFTLFYIKAKSQGVRITSRYIGVTATKRLSRMYWLACYEQNGKRILNKVFPFTAAGEIEAHLAYQQFLITNNLKVRKSPISRKNKQAEIH